MVYHDILNYDLDYWERCRIVQKAILGSLPMRRRSVETRSRSFVRKWVVY